MGADLLLAYTSLPHLPSGDVVTGEDARNLGADRILLLTDEQVRDYVDMAIGTLDFLDLPDDLDTEDADAVDAAITVAARARMREAVDAVLTAFEEDYRTTNVFVINNVPLLFTGGTSHGDTPSDEWDDVSMLGSSHIFDEPLVQRHESAASEAEANAVFDILVNTRCVGEHQREDFVLNHTHDFISEYRFVGSLGFGGKIYRTDARQAWRVSMYREDETPERLAMMEAANEALRALG